MTDETSYILRRKVNKNFTVLDNAIIYDGRLSWKALGLICYLLSLPDNFQLRLSHLAKQKLDGRDATRAGLKELENYGYLLIETERDSKGKYIRTSWTVTDNPSSLQDIQPETENPNADNPILENPNTIDPTLINTVVNKELISLSTTTEDLHSFKRLPDDERLSILAITNGLELPIAQALLDELEGALIAKSIKTAPVQWYFSLVERYRRGQFRPALGIKITDARLRSKKLQTPTRPKPKKPLQLPSGGVRGYLESLERGRNG